jgi:hypothetical protein
MKKFTISPLAGLSFAFVIISVYILSSQKRWKENDNSSETICSSATKQAAETNGYPVVITKTQELEKNKIQLIYHFVRGNRQNLVAVCTVNKGKPNVNLVSANAMLGVGEIINP